MFLALLRILALCCLAGAASAEGLSVLARIDPGASHISDRRDRTELRLALSQGVPHRVFTLDSPPRLVVDFQEVDFDSLRGPDLLARTDRVAGLRYGPFRPGWSRMVADLTGPLAIDEVGLSVNPDTGRALLSIDLVEVDAVTFAGLANPPQASLWELAALAPPPVSLEDRFTVVIDPGHGGVDPGAIRGDTAEKNLMLQMGLALRERLRREGDIEVVLTRDRDIFISLRERVAIAHQVKADLFLSLHADALSEGRARGATVYTLSDAATDAASAQLAAAHNRSDIIAGLDLSRFDDEVAGILMSLARQETVPRTEAAAIQIVEALHRGGLPLHKRPWRKAGFSVLKSADIPSVLLEVGFISDPRDLANLRNPVWRAAMVETLAQAVMAWRAEDETRRVLVRQ